MQSILLVDFHFVFFFFVISQPSVPSLKWVNRANRSYCLINEVESLQYIFEGYWLPWPEHIVDVRIMIENKGYLVGQMLLAAIYTKWSRNEPNYYDPKECDGFSSVTPTIYWYIPRVFSIFILIFFAWYCHYSIWSLLHRYISRIRSSNEHDENKSNEK